MNTSSKLVKPLQLVILTKTRPSTPRPRRANTPRTFPKKSKRNNSKSPKSNQPSSQRRRRVVKKAKPTKRTRSPNQTINLNIQMKKLILS